MDARTGMIYFCVLGVLFLVVVAVFMRIIRRIRRESAEHLRVARAHEERLQAIEERGYQVAGEIQNLRQGLRRTIDERLADMWARRQRQLRGGPDEVVEAQTEGPVGDKSNELHQNGAVRPRTRFDKV